MISETAEKSSIEAVCALRNILIYREDRRDREDGEQMNKKVNWT